MYMYLVGMGNVCIILVLFSAFVGDYFARCRVHLLCIVLPMGLQEGYIYGQSLRYEGKREQQQYKTGRRKGK